MNAPANITLDRPDEIRTLMGPISDEEYGRRAKLRSHRNTACAMASVTQSDQARFLAWQVIDRLTPWLYAPAPLEFLDLLILLANRLLRAAMTAEDIDRLLAEVVDAD